MERICYTDREDGWGWNAGCGVVVKGGRGEGVGRGVEDVVSGKDRKGIIKACFVDS